MRAGRRSRIAPCGHAAFWAAVVLVAATPAGVEAAAGPPHVYVIEGDLALGGHDPVAYFTESRPVAGRADLEARHDGARYRFASEANRDAFRADPGRYAPQYGGFCAYGMAAGGKYEGSPEAWTIVDGRLYINKNLDIRKKWLKDVPGYIAKAETVWKRVRDIPADEI